MKLIIDIPDRTYDFIMGLNQHTFGSKYAHKDVQADIVKAVKESTPYNPSGDCISREALKKAIEPYRYAICGFEGILALIDNAQTVEPFEPDYVGAERLKARQRGYEDGYHNGMKIGKTLNPQIKQGEWLFKHNSSDIWCSVCDENFDEIPQAFNFCPNCGADMRKG